jgi:hypothetical protein
VAQNKQNTNNNVVLIASISVFAKSQDSCRLDWLGNFQLPGVGETYGASSVQFHVAMTISKRAAKNAMGDLSFCDANGLASQLFAQLWRMQGI